MKTKICFHCQDECDISEIITISVQMENGHFESHSFCHYCINDSIYFCKSCNRFVYDIYEDHTCDYAEDQSTPAQYCTRCLKHKDIDEKRHCVNCEKEICMADSSLYCLKYHTIDSFDEFNFCSNCFYEAFDLNTYFYCYSCNKLYEQRYLQHSRNECIKCAERRIIRYGSKDETDFIHCHNSRFDKFIEHYNYEPRKKMIVVCDSSMWPRKRYYTKPLRKNQ